MKFTVFAALVAIALPAPALAAEWVLVEANISGDRFYIDLQSIRTMPNGYKRMWIRNDFAKPDKDGETSLKYYREYDCIEKRNRFLSIRAFSGEQVTSTSSAVSEWEYVSPDSVQEGLFMFVCRK